MGYNSVADIMCLSSFV